MNTEGTTDSAAAARHARFGTLPERIRLEDMVEETAASPRAGAGDPYNHDAVWGQYSCLALDLGL
ncbi:hypothetical protein [Streptomyces sp. NPDC001348]